MELQHLVPLKGALPSSIDLADAQESLAHSFEGVNLWEDALIIYEELEASFLQALKDQNLSWFDKLGGTDENDDSLPILDIGAKRYRDMLTQSAISVFDFWIYLFACQCKVLGKLGRVTEIAKRGQWFVASLARRLRENQVSWMSSVELTTVGAAPVLHRELDVQRVHGPGCAVRRVVAR